MEFVFDRLFNNAFFQLPFLEAMTYVGAFLVIAAGLIRVWDRARGAAPEPSEQPTSSQEMRKAA